LKKNTAVEPNTCDLNLIRVSRPIDFPALVFLLLLALILLLSGSAILSRASRPTSSSDRALDGAVADKASLVHEKSSLVQPQIVTLFSDPAEIRVSANYQQVISPIDSGLDKPIKKLSDLPSSPKNHIQPRGYRLKVNLVTRFHTRAAHLGENRFSQKFGVFWKEIGINGRRIKKRLTRLLRPVPSGGKNVAQQ
jgi:hypothetical protein